MIKKIKNCFVSFQTRTTLNRQLRVLLVGVVLPFIIMIIVLLAMLSSFNHKYAVILKNVMIINEFSDFKETLDLKMYYFVVGSKSVSHLPLEVVEHTETLLNDLQQTTTQSENQWRVHSMINLCSRLKECMVQIENTTSYDSRMEQLEYNVYTITSLIKKYMYEYLYDDIEMLSSLQQKISQHIVKTIFITSVISFLLVLFMVWYSIRITYGITKPIHQLCRKAERLGAGDFTVTPIETNNTEIQTLDDGFNDMIGRINALVKHVKEDQIALRRAEFELLQAQINPHFLYNTFDSIIWLAEAHKNVEVVKMTTNLSTFFRNSLSKGKDIISLAVEKQQVESYLEIQQIRYRDILEYEIQIPNELLEYTIPKLTLQPLVENALYHGIKNKRGKGKILITGQMQENDILLQVKDNGTGMSLEQLESLRAGIYEDRHTGLGLVNVHKRLKLYCGEQYGLLFDSILGEGTTVSVQIPKQNQLLE